LDWRDEERGRREAELAGGVIEALGDPILLIDGLDRVQAANAAARAIVPALRLRAPLAMTLRDPDVLAAVARARAVAAPQLARWREHGAVERVFEARAARVEGPGDLIALTLRDLTEAWRLERIRTDFVANASHELRTPLASLLGFIETLQGPARDDAAARGRFLDVMREQAGRMARLIDDLLSLSRVERSLHIRPTQPIDLAQVVGHIAETLAPLAESRGARIAVDLQPAIVAGERDDLARMAENLIENALKYGLPDEPGAQGARVEVGVAREGREAVLTVRDFGRGVAPPHLPRLTERFYRVDPGASRAQGGTGLGLALVKHVVARHGGRMTISSRLGEGATFRVAIPLIRDGSQEKSGS
jgi:two-component system phosphate regulon sensor histidine kinase PhoR